MVTEPAVVGGLAERPSGLFVPARLAGAPEGEPVRTGSTDPDGRRRVVLTRDVRRKFTRMAAELAHLNVAMLLACRTTRPVPKTIADAATGAKVTVVIQEPIPDACGGVLVREGEGTPDPGFGCACTRIHFTSST